MPILTLLGIASFWLIYGFRGSCTTQAPPIKDYERFNRDIIRMNAKQIKEGLKCGRW